MRICAQIIINGHILRKKRKEREREIRCPDLFRHAILGLQMIIFEKNICDSGTFHRLILFLMLISNTIKYILRFSMDRTMEICPFLGAEMKFWAVGK